jgi:mannose-6-phosphate isomerase-like protein (cupin superfamily)
MSDFPSSTKVKTMSTMSHAIRRVVTGHDDNGKAIVESDGAAPNVRIREGAGFVSTLLWVTDETPANVTLRKDRADRTIAVAPPANGTILRIVDFPPVTPEAEAMDGTALRRAMGVDHGGAPSRHAYMHRTKSVDYAIVLSGEIDMLLDDTEVHLKAGDILIQQATNHAWVNRSNAFCKIAFVLIDAHDPLANSGPKP